MEADNDTEVLDAAPTSWEMLARFAAAGDAKALEAYVDRIGPSEAFRAILRLDAEGRERVLTTLSPQEAADLIEEIPDEHASDLIERLPAKKAASILSAMDVDDQVDVIADMHDDDAEAILAEMTPEDAAHVRRLIRYDPDVAGGLMSTDYLAYGESVLVGDVISDLSQRADERDGSEHDAHVYVVSVSGKLIGVLDLRDLVLARRSTPLAALLKPSLFVRAEATLDELEAFFERYAFQAVPVIDEHQGLVGVVGRDEVADAIANRSQEEYAKSKGIIGGDEIRSLPVLTRARRRLSWLSLNIVLNIVAASVIAMYFDTLSAAIALAVFLPIVSDMSGCSGNQAVAVSMRELSLGIVKPFEVLRVWVQEIKVGVLNGITLGVLLGAVAWLWKDNAWLGLVVGGALAINTMVAVSLGGTVPLVLKRIGVDPAVASGPILTTVTDMCGFFLVLSLATLVLPKLAGV